MLCRSLSFVSFGRRLTHFNQRCLVGTPAINDYSPITFNPVLPFGFDFVWSDLRKSLESLNVDIDSLEKKYNNQIQNDAEFNNPALPSEGSTLWGYIYANRLVKAKVELNTLRDDESFKRNYLGAQIEELETRMDRYHPNLDWRGRVDEETCRTNDEINDYYEIGHSDAIANIISRDNGDKYISLFANNSFISQYDDNDKFKDLLPKNLESKLIQWFEFYFDHSSDNVDALKYFSKIERLEKLIETPLNALSKELKQNVGLFLLDCISRNERLAKDLIKSLSSVSDDILSDNSGDSSDVLVNRIVKSYDLKSGKISKHNSQVLGYLFFGSESDAAAQLDAKDLNDIKSILASVSIERLRLIDNAFEIEKYMNEHGLPRLFIGAIIKHCPDFVAQFLTNEENISSFESANSSMFDKIVASQKAFYKNQDTFASALNKFIDTMVANIGKDRKIDKGDLTSFVRGLFSINVVNACQGHECFVISALNDYANDCKDNNDTFGEMKGRTFANYLQRSGNGQVYWYDLLRSLLNPARNGMSGDSLAKIANMMANDTSNVSNVIFEQIGTYLHRNGFLSDNQVGSIKSDLSSIASKEWDLLKNASNDYDKSRIESENAIKSLSFNMEGNFHFDHICQTYDPLNVHLAQFRYLSPS